jgi:cholinesterase
MKRSLWCFVLVAIVWLHPAVGRAQMFSDIFVFGDGLSDTGNAAAFLGQVLPPPFFMNRTTNGPLGIDFLAQSLGAPVDPSLYLLGPAAGTNYAVASASAAGAAPTDLTGQVDAFLAAQGGIASPNALYVVSIGIIDVRIARDAVDNPTGRQIVDGAASATASNVRRLIDAGARHLLVTNAPDLGLAPESKDLGVEQRATNLSRRFREQLRADLQGELSRPDLRIVLFDLFRFSRSVVRNAPAFGIAFPDTACFDSVTTLTFFPACGPMGENADQFLFFNIVTPSARFHERLGRALFTVVPEPSQ